MMRVADLPERDLIARIQRLLPPTPPWMPVGIGDDAAVVEPERNRLEVLSVDSIVEGVHFDRSFVPADAIGHRALAVNLSDLAAMGAAPRLALLAMCVPEALPIEDFDAIAHGFCALAAQHRLHLAGGNLTRSPGPLMIDVTVVGTVKRRHALTRSGARVGDEVYVSGSIGAAAAGLLMLKNTDGTTEHRGHGEHAGESEEPCIERYLRPDPRVRLGVLLSRNRAASSCVDLSDGLADGAHRLAEASGVGIAIDAEALPIEASAGTWFAVRGKDSVIETVCGGDDYELLFTARRRMSRAVSACARLAGVPVTRIGVCTTDQRVLLRRAGGEAAMPASGYTHFAASAATRE